MPRADALLKVERQEKTYRRRTYRYKAEYSLDQEGGIEHNVLFVSLSPCEIYERTVTYEQLHAAIASLPDKQAKRIYRPALVSGFIAKTDHIAYN